VIIEHAAIINQALTSTDDAVVHAQKVISAFAAARERGEARVEVDGSLIELPIYLNAIRLVQRAKVLSTR
jgi:citrate lyase subunit beta/citryl-CoA lyase